MGYMSITPVQKCEHSHVPKKRNLDVIGCGDSEVLVRGRIQNGMILCPLSHTTPSRDSLRISMYLSLDVFGYDES